MRTQTSTQPGNVVLTLNQIAFNLKEKYSKERWFVCVRFTDKEVELHVDPAVPLPQFLILQKEYRGLPVIVVTPDE